MILLVLLLTFVYIFFSFLVFIIRFLFVLGNFLVDPSVNHFCDVGILIKDYPQVKAYTLKFRVHVTP